ncbi:ribosome recycling factor [Mitsuokella sp. oral taxon 131]|uniref:ribosome recycling factor n=1 Tax=Mitsuokella sp. oral taxon 131 TaxID=1321780 RepID=UPI0003AE0E5C|nr:ribosome recycling factor [Mitsuokella sp. oral taxon 131]ERL03634.1 ribosome recycling factor [Mitsuokella sp. oral taxon 131 str. W9106]
MVKDILASNEERMKKTIEALKHEYASLRAGRATPSLLDKVMVNYYGASTPVNQIAKVTVPEARMIRIQPWEKTMLHEIEVAIMKSELGLSPNSDGTAIRLAIPALTQERRQELVKTVSKKAEEAKVALRNVRRDGNEAIKKLEKGKEITEDDAKQGQESMQKLVDKYVRIIDATKQAKEKEVMEV